MARIAMPSTVTSQLLKQRGPLRAYQWLWLLLCVVGALAAAGPRILSRPVLYQAGSIAQVDTARSYAWLVTTPADDPRAAAARSEFDAVTRISTTLLRVQERDGQAAYPGIGSPTLNVAFAPQSDGQVIITATAPDAATAQQLADDAAEAFARSLRAAGGREILRNLLGWEVYAAYTGVPPRDGFQRDLRDIWVRQAFPLNRAIEFVEQPFTVDMLTDEDRSDLARALEVHEQELNKVDLVGLRGRINDTTDDAALEQLLKDERRLTSGLNSIRSALSTLYNQYSATFTPDAASAVYRAQVAGPGQLVDRQIPLLLGLTLLVGLVFGGLGVTVDRSAGVMNKFSEIWAYRELIRNLVLRDLRVRYKASVLGYLWTQLAPLLLMLVFLFVFSTLQRQPTALFPVYLIVGLLPWNFCAEAITSGARSIIDNANLIKKVFFPREILPMVSVLSALVNFLLSMPMMLLVMAVAQLMYAPLGRLHFAWSFAYVPILLMIQAILLTGIAFFMSAMAVKFRDFVHLIGILMQFWFFLTPVVYSISNLNLSARQATLMRWLNPMASLIEFYHESLYGTQVAIPGIPVPALPAADSVLRVLVTAVIILALGYWFFQRQSRTFGESL